MNNKVLLVDDDADILSAYRLRLGKRFDISTASGGSQALELLEEKGPVSVVVSDARMPGMDGVQFLGEVSKRAPDTVRIMLTGNTDRTTAVDAVNEGSIFRFFSKPCPPEELAGAIEEGVNRYNLIKAERDLLEQTLAGSVKVLIDVLSLVNPEAFQKTHLLRKWISRVAERMGLANIWELDIAAMLSPIGLITMPSDILDRARDGARLNRVDRETYERGPEVARNLISNIPRMKNLSDMIYYQNKGFDGSGFPGDSVAGEDIPVGGRLLKLLIDLAAICDSPDEAAISEIEKRAHLYDPAILQVARSCFVDEDEPDGGAETPKIVKVSIAGLRAGVRLMSNITAEDGTLVLAAGMEISQAHIEQLRNLQNYRKLNEPLHVLQPRLLLKRAAISGS